MGDSLSYLNNSRKPILNNLSDLLDRLDFHSFHLGLEVPITIPDLQLQWQISLALTVLLQPLQIW